MCAPVTLGWWGQKGNSGRRENLRGPEPLGLGLSVLWSSSTASHSLCGKSQDIRQLSRGLTWDLSRGPNQPSVSPQTSHIYWGYFMHFFLQELKQAFFKLIFCIRLLMRLATFSFLLLWVLNWTFRLLWVLRSALCLPSLTSSVSSTVSGTVTTPVSQMGSWGQGGWATRPGQDSL